MCRDWNSTYLQVPLDALVVFNKFYSENLNGQHRKCECVSGFGTIAGMLLPLREGFTVSRANHPKVAAVPGAAATMVKLGPELTSVNLYSVWQVRPS